MRLCTLLRGGGLPDSKCAVLEEEVPMFMWTLAHDKKNRNMKFAFIRSGQSVSNYFNNVLKGVLRLQGFFLRHRNLSLLIAWMRGGGGFKYI